ncbi:MAG: amidohydrolase family protein [Gammaproteobacteria bacterium]
MRVVALEEHFTVPAIAGRIDREIVSRRGFRPRRTPAAGPSPLELAPDLGAGRLRLMDEAGITMQVLSNTGPGPDLVPGPAGTDMARAMNDHLAEAVARHPDRFAGFAVLPMCSPDDAAAELRRSVTELGFLGALINGTTDGRFLDDPCYDGLLAEAAALDVPVYIHPHLAPEAVREAYFSGLEPGAGRVLEAAGWGWHSETALHVLRLVLSGTLDRHPRLKLIIGHMGEMLPMMMARADEVFALDIDHLQRPVSQTILDQVWITTSGIFTEPPFLAALLTFGIDRIMFSVDYPYASNAKGRAFLDRISLSPADMEKLTHGNADALLRLPAPSR